MAEQQPLPIKYDEAIKNFSSFLKSIQQQYVKSGITPDNLYENIKYFDNDSYTTENKYRYMTETFLLDPNINEKYTKYILQNAPNAPNTPLIIKGNLYDISSNDSERIKELKLDAEKKYNENLEKINQLKSKNEKKKYTVILQSVKTDKSIPETIDKLENLNLELRLFELKRPVQTGGYKKKKHYKKKTKTNFSKKRKSIKA
jgi:hypothetical protein